jgi:hypothetical protein
MKHAQKGFFLTPLIILLASGLFVGLFVVYRCAIRYYTTACQQALYTQYAYAAEVGLMAAIAYVKRHSVECFSKKEDFSFFVVLPAPLHYYSDRIIGKRLSNNLMVVTSSLEKNNAILYVLSAHLEMRAAPQSNKKTILYINDWGLV